MTGGDKSTVAGCYQDDPVALSTDDGGTLSCAWDLDADGSFDDATGATVDQALVTITAANGEVPKGRR